MRAAKPAVSLGGKDAGLGAWPGVLPKANTATEQENGRQMTPHALRDHKQAPKYLPKMPDFKPLKRNKLPKPFNRMGGGRVESTGLIDVSADHVVVFVAKNGELFTDAHFYGYLMCRLQGGALSPLVEFHWHPSHKGFHCKLPCRTVGDFADRLLVQVPEIDLKTNPTLDPRTEDGRTALVGVFCKLCGITMGVTADQPQGSLWKPS